MSHWVFSIETFLKMINLGRLASQAPPSFKRGNFSTVFSRGFRFPAVICLCLWQIICNFCSSNDSGVSEMLRFLSRRKSKSEKGLSSSTKNSSQTSQPVKPNKNIIVCKIIVLDGSDLTIELHVRNSFYFCILCII